MAGDLVWNVFDGVTLTVTYTIISRMLLDSIPNLLSGLIRWWEIQTHIVVKCLIVGGHVTATAVTTSNRISFLILDYLWQMFRRFFTLQGSVWQH